MAIHYYRRRDGQLEHSTRDDVALEEITIDRNAIEPLMGWPTAAMAPELDDDGNASLWYVGVTADGRIDDGTAATTYRAGYYVSADGQGSVVLTSPDQAHLSDADLHAAAMDEAKKAGLGIEEGSRIVIGDWTE